MRIVSRSLAEFFQAFDLEIMGGYSGESPRFVPHFRNVLSEA